MADKKYSVLLAPRGNLVHKSFNKSFADVVVESIPRETWSVLKRSIPDYFQEIWKQVVVVSRLEGFHEIQRPRHEDVLFLSGVQKLCFVGKLWLVCKDAWDDFPKILSNFALILLVRKLNKPCNRRLTEGIDVCLGIEPFRSWIWFHICVPGIVITQLRRIK